jgi:hypothetical protein
MQTSSSRTPFVLAASVAVLTSLYWAALAFLVGVASSLGDTSPAQLILPIILIGLYAFRGFQVFQGDPTAARSLLWLHGIGGVIGVMRMFGRDPITLVLYGIKVVLHVAGAGTAYWALQHATAPTSGE